MNSRNIFEIIRAKQLVSELSWRKRYANDTSTLNGETRYYKLEFNETHFDKVIDFVEVKKHTKLVPVVSWIPMNK